MFKIDPLIYSIYNMSPRMMRSVLATAYSYWSDRMKYGGQFGHWRDFLRRSQWYSTRKLRELQLSQIREIAHFAYEHSPFYREQMQKVGIRPEDLTSYEAFKSLPIVNKQIVKARHGEVKTWMARNPHLVFLTTGTTGAPLHVPGTAEALQREYAFRWHFQSVGGAQRGDRFAIFTGHKVVPLSRKSPPFSVRNLYENSIMFSLYHMSEESLPHYVDDVNDFKPEFVYGYPSGIYVLAEYILRSGKEVVHPKGVFTASEKLHPHHRRVIEEAFQAPVFEWYGQVEMTVNVQECDAHRLHVKEEYGLAEFLNDQGRDASPGELASVVGTGWGNKAFPVIRYDTGDKMVLAADQYCRCGRSGRIIEKIIGRDDDLIVTPDGRVVGSLEFVLDRVMTVRESQIVQETKDAVIVRIVPLPEFSLSDERALEGALREYLGDQVRVSVEKVSHIPRTNGGKVRYVVSHVRRGTGPI